MDGADSYSPGRPSWWPDMNESLSIVSTVASDISKRTHTHTPMSKGVCAEYRVDVLHSHFFLCDGDGATFSAPSALLHVSSRQIFHL